MMDCKKALAAAAGDLEKAIDELRNELVDLSTVEVVSVSVESESDLSVQEVAESGDVGALFTVAELEPAAGTDGGLILPLDQIDAPPPRP